eukprot:TRINITY_DN5951_c0_g1_i1.p1 TRINITY_DN5951_c0_g1~~TRINITY_DN5951_c0_g1_i1.p1  ORF type:complete len:242 (+),score=107.69 TRINITY_DN5951_c0_g1_i1:65-727(+)
MSWREERRAAENDDEAAILQRTEQHKRHIKGSLTRTAALCEQTLAQGAATNQELAKQGDTIDRIEENVSHTNQSMDYADSLISSIGSVWSALNPFGKKKSKKDKELSLAAQRHAATAEQREKERKDKAKGGGRGGYSAAAPKCDAAREQAAASRGGSGLDAEDEKMLHNITNSLGALKNMSLEMGGELDRQNHKLDELNPKMEKLQGRMKKSTKDIEKIL